MYLACDESLVDIQYVKFRITDDGFTVRDPAGPFTARVAMDWKDLPAFEHYLSHRISGR